MQHTELLHRFFDEGIEESLEDILFERMAVDPDLRREFLQHLKLHSMVQEDVASITTPSHVSQQLFVNLGLTPPESVPAGGLRRKIGTLAAGLRSQIAAKRRYIYTAFGSAAVSALLIFGLSDRGLNDDVSDQSMRSSGTRIERNADEAEIPLTVRETATRAEHARRQAKDELHASRHPAMNDPQEESSVPDANVAHSAPEDNRLHRMAGNAAVSSTTERSAVEVRSSAADIPEDAVSATSSLRTVKSEGETVRDAALSLPGPRSAAAFSGEPVTETTPMERVMDLADIEPVLKKPGDGTGEWHFFRPGPRANILSNLVFELRKYYGQSFPDVDQPHSSHNVFEDMAISAVYKVTEHHAFGFEYGREGFGRSYQDYDPVSTGYLDASVQELFDPPETMMMREVRENRMLDLFGAVWKLSLPEYGMFGIVYPYMRSFVGATRLGPLGKVRIGLEMFPSNFSMLNVGIEGGLLRYSVEDMAYYTSKLNFTFGVAIGF